MIDVDCQAPPARPRCASIAGFSVHANACISARDRMRLERLFRYAGRPSVATERLSILHDGRLLYRLKRCWRDGTTPMIFPSPLNWSKDWQRLCLRRGSTW